MEPSSPYRQIAPSTARSKNSSISSDKESASVAPSSKYTDYENQQQQQQQESPELGLEDYEEDEPINSGIIKRPSMYHSEQSMSSPKTTSRRQSLLNKRSQTLQQVDELRSLSPVGGASKLQEELPKFVVTNPDPVEYNKKSNTESAEDLKNFVTLMNSKGSKFSPEEIQQLKSLGKIGTPGMNRTSMMSQYSGVVEEVEEVQQIMVPNDKAHHIPSLVEVASTVHKRGLSSSNDDNSSKEDKISSRQKPDHKKSKSYTTSFTNDNESIKSAESIVNLGPLPTMGSLMEGDRSPDLSLATEIDPTIPPRSSRRPRSLIIVSPSSNDEQQQQEQTPTRESSKKSSIIRKRYSLPPPRSALPLTPTQLKELQNSSSSGSDTPLPPPPKFDYADILKKTSPDLQDRKRISSSSSRPLPEIPKDSEDEEEEVSKEVNVDNVDLEEIMNDLKQDSQKEDQKSEELLAPPLEDQVKSIISAETIEKDNTTTFHIKSMSSGVLDKKPTMSAMRPIISNSNSASSSNDQHERRIQFDSGIEEQQPGSSGVNYKKNFSTSSFTTDNASYHTADELEQQQQKASASGDNDEDYEDIEVVKSTDNTRRKGATRKHKKKSSSSSSTKQQQQQQQLRPFSISTLSKLLESTDGVIIGEEFDNLDISNEEKKYIEKIVDVIARLTADMVSDPSRHDGTITRMKAALRILEGFD